eukprot:813495_1
MSALSVPLLLCLLGNVVHHVDSQEYYAINSTHNATVPILNTTHIDETPSFLNTCSPQSTEGIIQQLNALYSREYVPSIRVLANQTKSNQFSNSNVPWTPLPSMLFSIRGLNRLIKIDVPHTPGRCTTHSIQADVPLSESTGINKCMLAIDEAEEEENPPKTTPKPNALQNSSSKEERDVPPQQAQSQIEKHTLEVNVLLFDVYRSLLSIAFLIYFNKH